ncbi:MAG TPA: PAS domain S-box protein, partial [Pyrinomonadaceae bacterium]|nr:PAS domain S-box protein [Pyrinomonadaceae bacterium]
MPTREPRSPDHHPGIRNIIMTLALVQSAKLSEERRSHLEKANEELEALRERERRRAEEELEGKENLLRLAVSAADMGTWDFDPVTGAVKWDARCKYLFGLPAEAEVSYEDFLARLHPEDRERTDFAVRRALDPASGGECDIEYRIVGLENRVERWAVSKGRALFDASGQPVRLTGTVLDTTERKRAEQSLIESEERYRAVAETASDAIITIDSESRIIFVNRAAERIFGHAVAEMVGQS